MRATSDSVPNPSLRAHSPPSRQARSSSCSSSLQPAALADSARAGRVERRREVVQHARRLSELHSGGQQPHPAVDVVADRSGRNDAARQLGGGDPADREAVALVHVRHHQHLADDPRQGGGVDRLLERGVTADRLEQLAAGEEPHRHPHVGAHRRWDLPFVGTEALEITEFDHPYLRRRR